MTITEEFINVSAHQSLYFRTWLPQSVDDAKGIVQIAHGMAEHICRYDEFAKFFTGKGFIVAGNDHRGHGKTAKTEDEYGFFSKKEGWFTVVDDLKTIGDILQSRYPNKKLVLLGHSMGSFLARTYFINYPESIDLAIISGTAGAPGLTGVIGKSLAIALKFFLGEKHQSSLLNFLSFGSFNKAFKPNKTEFDWLCSDEAIVQKYIADPRCGGIFTTSFFVDLLKGLLFIFKDQNKTKLAKHLPILFIAGENDPVGNFTKGVMQSINYYKSAGIENIEWHFYPGCRHEILNETIKMAVFQDVLIFIEKNLELAQPENPVLHL
jgi:alpha-beta hydrolase superfamily lysophospholipase